MTKEEREVFETALNKCGTRHQEALLIEEMSELTKEICKNWRGKDNLDRIAEEIADVQIMLDQMVMRFNCGGAVQTERQRKVERLRERLEARG